MERERRRRDPPGPPADRPADRPAADRRRALGLLAYVPPAILSVSLKAAAQESSLPDPP